MCVWMHTCTRVHGCASTHTHTHKLLHKHMKWEEMLSLGSVLILIRLVPRREPDSWGVYLLDGARKVALPHPSHSNHFISSSASHLQNKSSRDKMGSHSQPPFITVGSLGWLLPGYPWCGGRPRATEPDPEDVRILSCWVIRLPRVGLSSSPSFYD